MTWELQGHFPPKPLQGSLHASVSPCQERGSLLASKQFPNFVLQTNILMIRTSRDELHSSLLDYLGIPQLGVSFSTASVQTYRHLILRESRDANFLTVRLPFPNTLFDLISLC